MITSTVDSVSVAIKVEITEITLENKKFCSTHVIFNNEE